MKRIFKLLLMALLIPACTNAAGWNEAEYKRIEQSIQLPDLPQYGKSVRHLEVWRQTVEPGGSEPESHQPAHRPGIRKREADAW